MQLHKAWRRQCHLLLDIFLGCLLISVSAQPMDSNQDNVKIELRLAEGKTPYEGRVEIAVNGVWGTICDDYFSINTAKVICNELGLSGAEAFYYGGYYPAGNTEDKIWLDSLRCLGNESSVVYCAHQPWGVSDCSHEEDVAVRCKSSQLSRQTWSPALTAPVVTGSGQGNQLVPVQRTPADLAGLKVRLRGKSTPHPKSEGFVEIYYYKRWRPVCGDAWDMRDSRVICGQLGFSEALPIKAAELNNGVGHRVNHAMLTNFSCSGNESTLQECPSFILPHRKYCLSKEAAVARCERGNFVEDSRGRKATGDPQYVGDEAVKHRIMRLKSGAQLGEGRVEIYHNGEWGTLCGHRLTMNTANVVCRELGFGTAREVFLTAAGFGQGTGPVWLEDVRCTGDENSILDCPYLFWTNGIESFDPYCSNSHDAGIKCHVPDQRGRLKIKAVGGRTKLEGRLEVQHGRTWGSVCSDSWDIIAAKVACRQLGYGHVLQELSKITYFGGDDSPIIMSGVKCRGDELSLNQCQHDGWDNVQCSDHNIAGLICTDAGLPDLVPNAKLIETSAYTEDRPLPMLVCAMEEHCTSSSAYTYSPGSYEFAFGTRRLLRFSSSIANRGTIDFRPNLHKLYWEWHQCHGHHHSMEAFATYDITDAEGTKIAEGHKASFCLEDSHCDPGVAQFYKCQDYGDQGISVNCIDEYKHSIDCQWIDVTDVHAGQFLLRVHVNPHKLVAESDYLNNEILCNFYYNGVEGRVTGCRFANDD
ncbi:lysyl oxidase homolog 3A-like [Glandiceps talaboti]